MKAGLTHQLQLLDRAEAVQLVDEAGIRADRDAAAAILVIVHERHPQLIVLAPGDFVLAAPVEEEAAVVVAIRRVEIPQLRQRVLVVPIRAPRAHQIARGEINRERRIEREVQRDELLYHGVILLAAARRRLLPQPAGLAEAILL